MIKRDIIKNLLEGGRYTSVELNEMAKTPDARRVISALRSDYRNGIAGGADVQDEWRRKNDGTRYKVYWISQNLTLEGSNDVRTQD